VAAAVTHRVAFTEPRREGSRKVPRASDQPAAYSTGSAGFTETAPPQDLGSIWEAVTERVRASVPEPTFRLWLEPLRAAAAQGDTLYIKAPDGIRAWVERRYTALISQALSEVAAELRRVSFTAPESAPTTQGIGEEAALNPSYTFERFVIGESNRLAHAAALAVAEAPAEAYNPLFLHGPPGLGKTHLLAAIANYLREGAPQLNVRYSTAEAFTNEFVAALRISGAEEFKHRYRDLDVLLIDDVQFLEGKRHTEEEFFRTFNALYEAGSQLVLSADRIPSDLSTLAKRLRDRFEWGLTVAVEPPNLATRLTVLRRLAREAGVDVGDREALTVLARRVDSNIRQLQGALTRVVAYASLRARPLSTELVEEVISLPAPAAPNMVESIQEAAANAFQLPTSALLGPSRSADPLRARQLAIFLCRQMTDLSLPQIGRAFGGRDHTTVLHAIRRIDQRQRSGDLEVTEQLERIRSAVHNRSAKAP
jgi:chromosomal replication initiator protein